MSAGIATLFYWSILLAGVTMFLSGQKMFIYLSLAHNQTVRSYCLSRDCPISCARRLKCRLQKPSRDLLRNKNHLYAIILVHPILNRALKSRNHLLLTGYRLLKKMPKLRISSN